MKLFGICFHKFISERAYELQDGTIVGEVKCCLDCGKIERTGLVKIPKHYHDIVKEIKKVKK